MVKDFKAGIIGIFFLEIRPPMQTPAVRHSLNLFMAIKDGTSNRGRTKGLEKRPVFP